MNAIGSRMEQPDLREAYLVRAGVCCVCREPIYKDKRYTSASFDLPECPHCYGVICADCLYHERDCDCVREVVA